MGLDCDYIHILAVAAAYGVQIAGKAMNSKTEPLIPSSPEISTRKDSSTNVPVRVVSDTGVFPPQLRASSAFLPANGEVSDLEERLSETRRAAWT
jgi:hypothetical protein